MKRTTFPSLGLKVVGVILALWGAAVYFGEDDQRRVSQPGTVNSPPETTENKQQMASQESLAENHVSAPTDPPVSPNPLKRNEPLLPPPVKSQLQSPPADPVEFEKWAAHQLKTQFGHTIRSKGRQAELWGLRAYLMKQYPQNWQVHLDNILRSAFPQQTDRILETFTDLDTYHQWFEDNAAFLGSLDYETIKTQLTQKRSDIFGAAAAEIWSPNSDTVLLEDILTILDHAENIPVEDQFYLYKDALNDAYPTSDNGVGSSDADHRLSDSDMSRTFHLTTAFLSRVSVQRELAQMDPDERAENLYQIRRQMGFDGPDLEAMAQMDRENDQKWQHGLEYMARREELTQAYNGVELDHRLEALRQHYFQDQAQTIAAEEATNFFRYNRKRIYGRN